MKRIIGINNANENQKKQKLSKNAKVTAWLLAGAIASVGIEAGVKYADNVNDLSRVEAEVNSDFSDSEVVVDYFATTGGTYNTPNEIKKLYDEMGPENFYNAQQEGLEKFESGRSK